MVYGNESKHLAMNLNLITIEMCDVSFHTNMYSKHNLTVKSLFCTMIHVHVHLVLIFNSLLYGLYTSQ